MKEKKLRGNMGAGGHYMHFVFKCTDTDDEKLICFHVCYAVQIILDFHN